MGENELAIVCGGAAGSQYIQISGSCGFSSFEVQRHRARGSSDWTALRQVAASQPMPTRRRFRFGSELTFVLPIFVVTRTRENVKVLRKSRR